MIARRPLPAWAEIAVLPLVNIALAFITVGIIVRVIGVDPFHALSLLVVGAVGSSESIGYTLCYTTNFIFTGLAVAVAFHAGLFNIGGEGQAYIGGLGCGLAAGLARQPYRHHHHHVQLRRVGVDGLPDGERADRAGLDDAAEPQFRQLGQAAANAPAAGRSGNRSGAIGAQSF